MSDLAADGIGSMTPGHYGATESGITLAEITIAAAWNVQGNPERPTLVEKAERLFDIVLPLAPNTMTRSATRTALWLAPKSWLLVASANAGQPMPLGDFASCRDALNAAGGALFDVSASRVAFGVGGMQAGSVLAKSCPLDLHPRSFPTGVCAQSVLGRVNALIYKREETREFVVIVARSFAHDAWRTLCVSAAQYGYDVAPPLTVGDAR